MSRLEDESTRLRLLDEPSASACDSKPLVFHPLLPISACSSAEESCPWSLSTAPLAIWMDGFPVVDTCWPNTPGEGIPMLFNLMITSPSASLNTQTSMNLLPWNFGTWLAFFRATITSITSLIQSSQSLRYARDTRDFAKSVGYTSRPKIHLLANFPIPYMTLQSSSCSLPPSAQNYQNLSAFFATPFKLYAYLEAC